jgi:hypothetical protein
MNKKPGAGKRRRSRKAGAHGSKAEAIRQEVERQGSAARARDIIAALAQKGMEISAAHVANVRARMVTSGKKATGRRSTAAAGNGATVSLDQLVAAKQMAESLGGIDSARRMLDALERLR